MLEYFINEGSKINFNILPSPTFPIVLYKRALICSAMPPVTSEICDA